MNELRPGGEGFIVFVAVAGETNEVTITQPATDYVFDQAGGVLTAGFGCEDPDPDDPDSPVTCADTPTAHREAVVANLGDMDDTVNAAGDHSDPFEVNGGAGSDTLTLGQIPSAARRAMAATATTTSLGATASTNSSGTTGTTASAAAMATTAFGGTTATIE